MSTIFLCALLKNKNNKIYHETSYQRNAIIIFSYQKYLFFFNFALFLNNNKHFK